MPYIMNFVHGDPLQPNVHLRRLSRYFRDKHAASEAMNFSSRYIGVVLNELSAVLYTHHAVQMLELGGIRNENARDQWWINFLVSGFFQNNLNLPCLGPT
jgi:hypothetical protein